MGAPGLTAVIFDVDGTLVDSERDGHRVAFNEAFAGFGLPYRWDPGTYGRLLDTTGGQRRLHRFLAEQGMDPPERESLVPRLHIRKTELFLELAATGAVPARPGALRLLDELALAGVLTGVATTGSRAWVEPLLARHFGPARFAAIVTGEDVTDPKPDPSAYVVALARLGVGPAGTVAVEDSDHGVASARAAGLAVAAVTNEYTTAQALEGAAVVLDSFGTAGVPARVRRDPARVVTRSQLDLAALAAIAAG